MKNEQWKLVFRYSIFLNVFGTFSLCLLYNVCIQILLLIFIRSDIALFVHFTAGTLTPCVFRFTVQQLRSFFTQLDSLLTGLKLLCHIRGVKASVAECHRMNEHTALKWIKRKPCIRRQLTCICSCRKFSLADVIRKNYELVHMWLNVINRWILKQD